MHIEQQDTQKATSKKKSKVGDKITRCLMTKDDHK